MPLAPLMFSLHCAGSVAFIISLSIKKCPPPPTTPRNLIKSRPEWAVGRTAVGRSLGLGVAAETLSQPTRYLDGEKMARGSNNENSASWATAPTVSQGTTRTSQHPYTAHLRGRKHAWRQGMEKHGENSQDDCAASDPMAEEQCDPRPSTTRAALLRAPLVLFLSARASRTRRQGAKAIIATAAKREAASKERGVCAGRAFAPPFHAAARVYTVHA